MYAVIETGGKQYRVEVGSELAVELLDAEPGQEITLDQVLLVADGDETAIGRPTVADAAVQATVLRADRADKVISFKYKPKTRRRVKKGHRQEQTVLRITDVRLGTKSAAAAVAAAEEARASARQRAEEEAAAKAAADAVLAAALAEKAKAAEEAAAEEAAADAADRHAAEGVEGPKKPRTRARGVEPAPEPTTTAGPPPEPEAAEAADEAAAPAPAAGAAARPRRTRAPKKED